MNIATTQREIVSKIRDVMSEHTATPDESGRLDSEPRDYRNQRSDRGHCYGSPNPLAILCYHRVSPDTTTCSYPYRTSAVTASQFYEQMNYLRRHYQVLPLEEALSCLNSVTLPKRAVSITFDDGYLELMDAAFPVLRDLHLPATVFLVVEHVGTDLPFWWEEVTFRLYMLNKDKAAVAEFVTTAGLRTSGGWPGRISEVVDALKIAPNALREKCLSDLRALTEKAMFPRMSLNWDEVRQAQSWGITFGSHSLTHPILPLLSDEALERELQVSRETVESTTGTTCRLLAYPNGDHDDRVRIATQRAGYHWAVTMERGRNTPSTNPLALWRYPIEAHHNSYLFTASLRGWLDFPPWVFKAIRVVRTGMPQSTLAARLNEDIIK